jgi:hypothetical protein
MEPHRLSATNLALRDRFNPTNSQVHANMDNPGNPENPRIVCSIVTKDNCKYNAAKITGSTNNPG